MDFLGLVGSYPKQRLLTDLERSHRLDQKRFLNVQPRSQLSIIRMNSSYLESVDKWFAWKGLLTATGSTIAFIFLYGIFTVGFQSVGAAWGEMSADDKFEELIFSFIIVLLSLPPIWLGIWLMRKEAFRYTHYPIRFSYQTRMVHVFRTDGTILSAPWDEIFFTLGHLKQWNEWEVRGHVLEPDKVTVRETFALSYSGSLNSTDSDPRATDFSSDDCVRAHWEFVRRYMEDGPQEVSGQVRFCMPVDKQKERLRVGAERVFANFAGAPLMLYCLLFPFCVVISIFRWFAMMTSKVPHWPDAIEAGTKIEPNDPYAIEATSTGERVAVFPEAALAAGVRFHSQSSNSGAVVEATEQGKRL
jgi:hypothetical protein